MKITETCLLEDRGIIYIEGADTKEFLQNIVTNNLDFVSESRSIYSSILTPQGKYLFDFILVKHKKGYVIDCEKIELENLIKALNVYKLRSKYQKSTVLKNYLAMKSLELVHPENSVVQILPRCVLVSFEQTTFCKNSK